MDKIESKFKLRGIVLVESNFRRIPEVIINQGEKTETKVDVKSENKDSRNLATEVTIELTSTFENKTQFLMKVVMVGLFEAEDCTKEQIDNFSKINAPAIIFPFVREHVISMTIKAGLPPIALPIINFVENAKKQESDEK